MSWRQSLSLMAVLAGVGFVLPTVARGQDLNDLEEKAIKAAVKQVAPSVVRIDTQGGTDIVVVGARGTKIRKPIGSTTGLIVESNGYIVSSAFNFINKPSTITVAVPGRAKPFPAKIIANDFSRMLTLLKIEATGLPVPKAAPRKRFQVGQWSVSLGRTLDTKVNNMPSISIGIISATDRIWGKAVQIDSKVSPVNYGGPAIDVEGRVQGVMVPLSPSGEDSSAGIEWYDSGIGFAVPLEDINIALPRLKKGVDLKKGLLGVTLPSPYNYAAVPVVGTVTPGSAAFKAGIKTGDMIIEIEGKTVERVAQIAHLIGPKYEGDTVSVKLKRGDKTIFLPNLKLVSTVASFTHAFLGIIPMRDDPELGVELRYVYPKSPADRAGLKAGDRIMKVGIAPRPMVALNGSKSGRDQLTDLLNPIQPGTTIKLEVVRKQTKKVETVSATLESVTDTKVALIPDALPEVDSAKKARDPRVTLNMGKPVRPKPVKRDPNAALPDTGLMKRFAAGRQHSYYLYVDEDYDPNIAHGLVLWLHPPRRYEKLHMEELQEDWSKYCADNHLILVCPITESPSGWVPSDASWVISAVKDVMGQYTVDPRRVVAHGHGRGGQMAFYLGFNARDMFRGVATMGSVLTKQPPENLVNQRLAFFVATGTKDPLHKPIADSARKLSGRKYPVTYREIKNVGTQYLLEENIKELVRWIDSLDRL